jgi:hypothetical protein
MLFVYRLIKTNEYWYRDVFIITQAKATVIHEYLTINWGISVCLCVCLSGYTFPNFSTDLLQIWREHYTGHDTYRGLFI